MIERPTAQTFWQNMGTRFLPFADSASADLPLSRLLRLSLFQVSVGIAMVLLNGTLNRVMIVELGAPTWMVALAIALPLIFAPFRALVGHRSDTHRSTLGWRRVPYIWFGTLGQFGGLAIMPFALLLLSRPDTFIGGAVAACLAFLLTGAGMHVTQTAGLALATDLAPPEKRPQVVALLYVTLLVGMMISALVIGQLLLDFSGTKLVQIVQGAAALTMVLNVVALWKQEPRRPRNAAPIPDGPSFGEIWAGFVAKPGTSRLLVAIGLGALAFSMQDALLEPFGGEILGLSVGATTGLTAAWALGALCAFTWCARRLASGAEPLRLAGIGAVVGILAFLMTLFAAPLGAAPLLYAGALAIGFGNGLFSVGTMIAAMELARDHDSGLALGAWGAVQASCAGAGIALGGVIRDGVAWWALSDGFGATLAYRATGYGTVYFLEVVLLFATLIVLGPVAGLGAPDDKSTTRKFELAEFPT